MNGVRSLTPSVGIFCKSAEVRGLTPSLAGRSPHVQENPDRQPRRDRLPDHQKRAPTRHPHRSGLLRGRPRRAACRDGGRGGGHRAGTGGAVVSRHRQDRGGLPTDGRRRGASGLRVPLGARSVPDRPGQGGHRVHRAEPEGDRRHGRQDREQEGGSKGQSLDRAGLPGRDFQCAPRGRDRGRDRLPRDDQGLGRRRRQGHAHRLYAQGDRGGLRAGAVGGQVQLRRRPGVHREVHREPAARRDPGAGGQARHGHPPGRARMLDPASQPEGRGGGAIAPARRQDTEGDGRAGGRAREGRGLRQRRHGGVRGRAGSELLLPGDEHAAPGGASRHRAGDGHRPGRADDPCGGGREAQDPPGGREAERLGGGDPHLCGRSVPQFPALHRPPHTLSPAPGGHGRGRHGAHRHRRVRGRRDLHVLRSD